MNDRQEAKLRMYQVVLETCHKNEQTYAGVPGFVNSVAQLDDSVAAIVQNAQQQTGAVLQGASAEKNAAIDLLAQECVKTANVAYVYAFTTGNLPLMAKVAVNKGMFYRGHYNDALILAKTIAAATHEHAPALAEYGIDTAAVNALDEAIAGFERVMSKSQVAIGERKMYTSNIKQLFADSDSVLYDRLDKLIVLFKTSAPDFYVLYKNARNIIDTAKRSSGKKENA
jgi:hypothetical protein